MSGQMLRSDWWKIDKKKEKKIKASPAKPAKFVSGTICSGLMRRYVFVPVSLSAVFQIDSREWERDNTQYSTSNGNRISLYEIYITSTKTTSAVRIELNSLLKAACDWFSVAHGNSNSLCVSYTYTHLSGLFDVAGLQSDLWPCSESCDGQTQVMLTDLWFNQSPLLRKQDRQMIEWGELLDICSKSLSK